MASCARFHGREVDVGWRGALRSMHAAAVRQQRANQRELRELNRQAKERQHHAVQDAAQKAVARYEAQIRMLTSMHRECGPRIDWRAVANATPLPSPAAASVRTQAAEAALVAYRPRFLSRLLGRTKAERSALEQALEVARGDDERETRTLLAAHAEQCRELEEAKIVGAAILRGDTSKYAEALRETDAFDNLGDEDAGLTFHAPSSKLATLHMALPKQGQVVPDEILSVSKRGLLSSKPMPKTRAAELYQDFICGMAMRVCREVLAALPIECVLTTLRTDVLDDTTGHLKSMPVLSLIAPRRTVEGLNFDAVDASAALANFLHRISFKKTSGLAPVIGFTLDEVPNECADRGSAPNR